ncbi:zinc finger protein 184 [Bactrocera dorsalis]|uniref:Zinc finger protein 184 n=1 Tax=Bactrocera dorsalis TaxID=27457 RepID=A0A6I9W502_BACDO|nr:zinc finger protein 184 [Bactrocera dorsalis]
MGCYSDNDFEISISQIQMVERCCICQEQSSSFTIVEKSYIGTPPISTSDLLLQCFDSLDKFRLVLGEQPSNNFICDSCEKLLVEFYDAVKTVSIRRNKFLDRVKDKNKAADEIEYFVIIESTKNDAISPHPTTNRVMEHEPNSYPSEEEFVKIIDSDDEHLTLNISEDEFVKVNQPAEEFKDEWSSDCSVNSDAQENPGQMRKALITIERMPKTKLRFCWRCDKNFPSDDAFETHLKVAHTKSKKTIYSCHQCQKSFTSEDEHNTHLSKFHYTDQSRCDICGALFDSSVLLNSHKIAHKQFKCSICSKMMLTQRMLQRHMMGHRMDKKHQCSECGNKYISKTFLQKHMLVHKDSRSFVCQVCDFQFRTAWNLKRHQKLHCLGDISRKLGDIRAHT